MMITALLLSLITNFSAAQDQSSATVEIYCECVIYNSDMIQVSSGSSAHTATNLVIGRISSHNKASQELCLQAESERDIYNYCTRALFNAQYQCQEKARSMGDGSRSGSYFGDLRAGSCQGPYLSE